MRILALFAGGFCAAILGAALGLPLSLVLPAALLLAVLISAGFALRRGWSRRGAIVCLGLLVGLGWSFLWWALELRPLAQYDGQIRSVTAVARESSRETDYGTSTAVRLELDGRTCNAILYGDETLRLTPGDQVSGMVKFRLTGATRGADNLYYGAGGEDFTLSLKGKATISKAETLSLRDLPAVFSDALKAQLRRLLPEEESGYAVALLSGDRSGMSDLFYYQLGLSGTRHVVAVSGMHIGIFMGALLLLFGNRRRLAAFLGLPIIWFFALAVGMTASVVRAAIMQSFLMLAPVFRRENDPPTSILAALMLILLPNPRAILDVGLQLSFASIAGISLFSGRLYRRLWDSVPIRALIGKCRLVDRLLKVLVVGVVSALSVIPFTMPLCLLYFDMVSLAAPLSSALIVPFIPVCFSLSILCAILGWIWMPLGMIVAWPLRYLLSFCMALTRGVASLPFAAVSGANGYMLAVLAGMYGIVTVLSCSGKPCRLLTPICCMAALFCVSLLLSVLEYDGAELSVTMLDVGQGQCVYVESKGVSALYDCGGDGSPAQTAAQFLTSSGCLGLDFLTLSHYDEDHAGGVAELLELVPVKTLYLPPEPDDNGMQAEILAAAEANGCRVELVSSDLTISFGSAVVTLCAPVNSGFDNNASVAAHWRADEFDVLLTGDMDEATEKALTNTHHFSQIEVLVAGHHGSATSTGEAILELTTPEIVLISVGADNSYGHPADETLERLAASGAAVYRTDQCGNITVRR